MFYSNQHVLFTVVTSTAAQIKKVNKNNCVLHSCIFSLSRTDLCHVILSHSSGVESYLKETAVDNIFLKVEKHLRGKKLKIIKDGFSRERLNRLTN